MRKIFTFIMCLFGIMAANATTTTIWEETGGQELNWDDGKTLNLDIASKGIVDGSTVTVHYELIESASYNSGKFVSGYGWKYQDFFTQLDGLTGGTFSIDVTSDIITKCNDDGGQLNVVGYGIKVTKVELTIGSTVEDLPAATLWQGSQEITGWGGTSLSIDAAETLAPFKTAYTSVGNMYILVEPSTGANIRIAGLWGAWSDTEFPSVDYKHEQNMDADNVVKVELTEDFVDKAFGTDGKGFALWGNGYTVKAIGTTKQSVTNPTAINDVKSAPALLACNARTSASASKAYNLAGQRVSANAKGIMIINGKKVVCQ